MADVHRSTIVGHGCSLAIPFPSRTLVTLRVGRIIASKTSTPACVWAFRRSEKSACRSRVLRGGAGRSITGTHSRVEELSDTRSDWEVSRQPNVDERHANSAWRTFWPGFAIMPRVNPLSRITRGDCDADVEFAALAGSRDRHGAQC